MSKFANEREMKTYLLDNNETEIFRLIEEKEEALNKFETETKDIEVIRFDKLLYDAQVENLNYIIMGYLKIFRDKLGNIENLTSSDIDKVYSEILDTLSLGI